MDFNKLNTLRKSSAPSDNTLAIFCGGMFQILNTIKLAHLKAKGPGAFAQHVALGDLYDAMSDLADEITEMLQGYLGIMDIVIPESKMADPLSTLRNYRDTLISMIQDSKISSKPDVQNKLQDLLAHFTRTIYKLENLQ